MRARFVLLALVALTAAAAIAALAVAGAGGFDRNKPSAYQRALLDQPGPGPNGDPATQRQRGLVEAARQHTGIGARGGKPARNVKPGKLRHQPADVLPNTKSSGRLAGGCVLGYGAPGDECLPPRAPHNRPVTCAYALELFPAGIHVTGRDVLGLDSNKDGHACGHGDRGVP